MGGVTGGAGGTTGGADGSQNEDPPTAAPSSDEPNFFRRHKHWWAVAAVLLLIIIVSGIAIYRSSHDYTSEVVGPQSVGACSQQNDNPNSTLIKATVIAIDTDSLTATIRLDFFESGNLVVENNNSPDYYILRQPLTLTTMGLLDNPPGASISSGPSGPVSYTTATSSYVFPAGSYMQDLDLLLPLVPGSLDMDSPAGTSTARYPWDTYTNTTTLRLQIKEGIGTGGGYIPSCVELSSSVGGWKQTPQVAVGVNSFNVAYQRTGPVKFYAYFVIALMWALSLGGVAMAVIMMMRRQDEIDTGAFAYLAALLFAFPLIRQTLPGNPGPGSLIDIVAYYWTEVIVAATLVVLLIRWITITGKREHRTRQAGKADPPAGNGADAATVPPG
jgi:Domain of unknown function (DUF4436)